MTVLTKLMKHLIFLFKIYIFSAILMKLNLLSWNVDGVMQSALALDNVSSNYDIDICAISEHKLFNDNLYFVDSINNQYESFSRSDASLDPFNSFRRGKGGVSLVWKRNLNAQITRLTSIECDRI
ncbi:unnamed protein product [Owenia fusiformis]|nr:unnamed protein product [Owenia fusiformis]